MQRQSSMAIQTPDGLLHNGFVFAANAEEALIAYFATHALAALPDTTAPRAKYLRRYRSNWEIRNERLYLMKLQPLGYSETGAYSRR